MCVAEGLIRANAAALWAAESRGGAAAPASEQTLAVCPPNAREVRRSEKLNVKK